MSDPISHAFVSLTTGLRSNAPDDVRQRLIETEEAETEYLADLWERCGGKLDQVTAASCAGGRRGKRDRPRGSARACQALGWAMAQAVTLVAPEVIVVGGGVSLMDESLFLVPILRWKSTAMSFRPWRAPIRLFPPS